MRARIISLIIIVILIGGPLGIYWFFMVKQESSLTVITTQEVDFTVDMKGTLDYGLLPLADKLLDFHRECHGTCKIGPLPPAKYDITLSSPGNIDSTSTIQLLAGSGYTIRYDILSGLNVTQLTDSPGFDVASFPAEYTPLASIRDKILVLKDGESERSLGLYNSGAYRPTRQIPDDIKSISMDDSKEFIILGGTKTTVLISKDFKNEVEVPLSLGFPGLVSNFNGKWKIRTPLGVFQELDAKWEENLRFSDFIDISPYVRIGYISGDDTSRLSLSNLTLGEGVFVSLDRKTGKSYILKNGVDITGFAYFGNKPGYIGSDGKRYIIDYRK